ncbi:hypothetical protein N015_18755 [Pseudomonas asturiensis]|uniref:Uncharacterized protein n=1 Tax=Pseudomonas asturiensis TaxID=1190415 RepID=A0ABX6HFL1_9PSED|nr:hypothetical protein [Pseudomonas asturiensis]QHF04337.1 hypothetical protein N015_18755 [Pseudomonas asturiensis]
MRKQNAGSTTVSLPLFEMALLQLQGQLMEDINLILESGDGVERIEELQIRAGEYVEMADFSRMPLSLYTRNKLRMSFQNVCEQIEEWQFQLSRGSGVDMIFYR